MKYSNPTTQAYVDNMYRDIEERNIRIASMRRSVQVPAARIPYTSVKISSLSPEDQAKVIRLVKES